jgi:hypothetical protein
MGECVRGKGTTTASKGLKVTLRFSFRVFTVLLRDSRRFLQRVCPVPRVWPLNSQVAFLSQFSGIVFNIAEVSKGFTGLAWTACPSRCVRSLCSAFQRFSFG